ncbi:hypothetical protein [Streptomyces kronopolitis]|uniref:hypothetical protein n=1 Tax=Streptomyces kronopolitis TaxID=1612435 RepID=UPI00343FA73E
MLSRDVAHGGKLLLRGGEAGLDRGDLAEPSLVLGLREVVEQVRVDLLRSGHLLGIGPQDGTADAGVSVDAGSAEVTCAGAEGNLRSSKWAGKSCHSCAVGADDPLRALELPLHLRPK